MRNSGHSKKRTRGEDKNQLDLFRDWTVELAKRGAAAATAAKEAATKRFEELRAGLDERSAKFCGILITALTACLYKEVQGPFVLTVALTAALLALLTAVPFAVSKTPRLADRALRTSNHLATVAFVIGVTSFVVAVTGDWLLPGPPHANAPHQVPTPKVASDPTTAMPDEKSVTEEAQRQIAAQKEREAAWAADCLSKEKAVEAARRAFWLRDKELAKCKEAYARTFTLKSLDAYCGEERARVDTAARTLDARVAKLCSSTGSTNKK